MITSIKSRLGFTLIEMMITVLVTSIVVIAAYALLNGTTSNFDNEDDVTQLRANLRNAEMLIQRDIGRAAFRAGYQVWSGDGTSDISFQSIRHSRNVVNGDHFSQLTLIGDITDFGYFFIDRASGSRVTFDNTALTGLQGNDCLQKVANPSDTTVKTLTCPIGYCKNCVAGSEENGTGLARFHEAFLQAFRDASAVRFTAVTTNESSIRKMKSIDASTNALELNQSLSLPEAQGFAAFCTGDKITPITAMTYTVMAMGTENVLVRCTHNADYNANINNVLAKSCAVVLRNVDYFDIFPLKQGVSMSQQLSTSQSKDPITTSLQGNLTWQSTPVAINTLTGLLFRIGVHGPSPAKNPQLDTANATLMSNNAGMYYPPFFVDSQNRVFNRAHIQSSATIYTQPNSENWSAHTGAIATLHDNNPLIISWTPSTK